MTSNLKTCKGCGKLTPKADFVSIYGYPNPRAKYCKCCYDSRERQHVMELMDGRDFCLYCGRTIAKYCDYDERGRGLRHYMELDHMDPISKGGHDDVGFVDLETGESMDTGRNTVYCCRGCNQKKKHSLFTKWIETLEPQYKALAIEVYKQKHDGKAPDEFQSDFPSDLQIDYD